MILVDTWKGVLVESFQRLWLGIISFIPHLIVDVVILCIGWAIGALIARGIEHFMKTIKFDESLKKAGFEDFVKRSGLNLNSGRFVGNLVKYFIVIAILLAVFNDLGLVEVTGVLRDIVVGYLPQVIVAVLVLLVGIVVGDVLSRIVVASSKTAGLSSANFLGVISKWLIWIVTILIVFDKIGVTSKVIDQLFGGVVIAVSLGLGLAFGLGGQQAAAKTIERVQEKISGQR